MIQRLLRGRLLYVMLGLLVLCLYAPRAIQGGPGPASEGHGAGRPAGDIRVHPPTSGSPRTPLEWWPEGLDAETMAQRLSRAPQVQAALSVLTTLMVAMCVGGLFLSLKNLWSGRLRSRRRAPPHALPAWSFGEVWRLLFLAAAMASLLPFVRATLLWSGQAWAQDLHRWLTVSMVWLDVFVILAIMALFQGKGLRARDVLGRSPSLRWQAVGTAFRGYLALFPWLFAALFLIVEVARRLGVEPPVEPIHELLFEETHPVTLGLTLLLACAIGPIAEECFFRGVLYASVRRRTPRMVAMLVSAALFALIHTNWLGFVPIMALGCLLADLYERTGSLIGPMAVHMAHNTFLISLALVFKQLMALE